MKTILEELKGGKILVADGAMGSLLFERGLGPGDCPEELNLKKPELLEEIARLYLDAGAQIIQTNTFGGSPLKLEGYHLEGKTEEINRSAVEIVGRVCNGCAYVSASCGPSGRILRPYGDTDPDTLYASFERQATAFTKADIICVETMTDLGEAVLAVRAAKTACPNLPVMATMTFDKTPRGFFTIMGTTISQAAASLEEAGADIVGSNCGNGIENMILIARELKAATTLPILIQSNAGQPEVHGSEITYPETPEFFAEKTKELIAAGVSIIGGCCGSTPQHIQAIREAVRKAL